MNPEFPKKAAVYGWENKAAIKGYTGGPYPDDPFDIERGSLEARSGLFLLDEVSDLGIMASKLVRGRDQENEVEIRLDDPIFIPWASVHSIRLLQGADTPPDDEE